MKKDFFEEIKNEKEELKDIIDIIRKTNDLSVDNVIKELEENNLLSFHLFTNDKKD